MGSTWAKKVDMKKSQRVIKERSDYGPIDRAKKGEVGRATEPQDYPKTGTANNTKVNRSAETPPEAK